MSASLIFMVPAQISVGSTIPIVVARKNIGSSTPGVVEQNGPRHPASCRRQSISRVYTCLLSALRCGEGWFNGEKMLYRIMQTAHTVLFLWDIQYCFYGTCDMHLLVFSAFSWEISWVVAGRYGAKWQHTICALSVCKRDVSRILHFVHAKLSSFPKSLLEETWKREPSKKNITIYQQRHHYHNLHHKHNHDNHHFIHIHLVSSHPPSLAPFALSHSENRAIGSVSVLKEYSVTCGCWRAISWGTAEKFSEQLCFFVVPAKRWRVEVQSAMNAAFELWKSFGACLPLQDANLEPIQVAPRFIHDRWWTSI